MIHFKEISRTQFLKEYWQKKPLLIKQALPNFISPMPADELAGLALEEEFESRLITGSTKSQDWSLRNGAFTEQDFTNLPAQDWTLLVQGVDRYIDEVHDLIQHFDFIPRWRFDDVMISYAAKGGSVGPHFDHYDVFLLQGSGKRRWHLSSKNCEMDNYLDDAPLRIMNTFPVEQTFDVEPGDVLYVPPKIAHHGVSLDDNCTTLSFGYRAYSAREMHEFIGKTCPKNLDTYYQDPEWQENQDPNFIPESALKQAQKLLDINAEQFAQFVTKLDTNDVKILQEFEYENPNEPLTSHPASKIAYIEKNGKRQVFINGEPFRKSDLLKMDE
ncbi:MAG: 50S ribosomal protein L16 3-hydroxylase [Catillopecten margaritatus gill symbiont]|uniref:50S ribosomal protein L16 3-hydroxylase n=1 Tax=Catillopecten margaritatus gill symbiont TaxID=3083288 RepID=A0AAU6PG12_9GAMM